MTTRERIFEIWKIQYNNFGGLAGEVLYRQHLIMQLNLTPEQYLEFIEKDMRDNPRPVYENGGV